MEEFSVKDTVFVDSSFEVTGREGLQQGTRDGSNEQARRLTQTQAPRGSLDALPTFDHNVRIVLPHLKLSSVPLNCAVVL